MKIIVNIWSFMLANRTNPAFGMRSASAANSSMPMMNAAGLGGLGSVSSSSSLYSINNMAASLLAQSKFSIKRTEKKHKRILNCFKNKDYYCHCQNRFEII